MATLNLWTYRDTIKHLVDFLGAAVNEVAKRDARRATLNAYRDFANAFHWSYFYTHGRINTVAIYNTGTIAYVHTGGSTCERQLTLTGGTWPSWAAYGTVTIANANYEVSARKSDTVLQLSVNFNPGSDIAALTTYTLFRDTYPMPVDFISADAFLANGLVTQPTYLHPTGWLNLQPLYKTPTQPRVYTFMGDPRYMGGLCVRFHPPPDQAYEYDFVYARRPRSLSIDEYSTGTATTTNGSSVVSGVGTTWTSSHIGCVIRFASSRSVTPEGLAWDTPFVMERTVIDVPTSTSITLDTAANQSLSGVGYAISDPVDLELGSMLTAFLRCCEYQVSIGRKGKGTVEAQQLYKEALKLAAEADSRSFATRVAGIRGLFRQRLANMPMGSDIV